MAEAQKEKGKGSKGALIGLAVVVAVLALSNIYTYMNLQSQISVTQAEITRLQNENTNLRNTVNSLSSEITRLQNENTNLRNTVNSLSSEITRLQNENTNLRERNAQLEQIINMQKIMILDKDKTVNLTAGASTTLYYSTSYAGYIKVDFTASGPIYFKVGNGNYGYYARYPETGTATSGSFIIPVLPGSTHLYIEHPGLILGASVTFTVTYVY